MSERDKGSVAHGRFMSLAKCRLEQQVMLQEEQNEAVRQQQALQEQRPEEEEEEDEEEGDNMKGAGVVICHVYLLQGNINACNHSMMHLASPGLITQMVQVYQPRRMSHCQQKMSLLARRIRRS